MTKEVLKLALEAFDSMIGRKPERVEHAITAIKEALEKPQQEPVAYGMWDTMIGCGGRMMYVRLDKGQDGCTVPLYTHPLVPTAQPKKPKYRRGDRLICLETEEYCVIHISGTDRQWVKFPDSHIGVYTNEQVSELFELLPKEPESDELELAAEKSDNYASFHAGYRFAVAHHLAQPEQEPVAFICEFYADEGHPFVSFEPVTHGTNTPLYTTPPQRKPLEKEMREQMRFLGFDTLLSRTPFIAGWLKSEAAHGIKE